MQSIIKLQSFSIVVNPQNERMLVFTLETPDKLFKVCMQQSESFVNCVFDYFFSFLFCSGPRSGKLFQKETLHKVHSEWLIPLRPIVSGIQSENERDDSELANQILCSLNPVQLVLYRCIELAEEKMKCC